MMLNFFFLHVKCFLGLTKQSWFFLTLVMCMKLFWYKYVCRIHIFFFKITCPLPQKSNDLPFPPPPQYVSSKFDSCLAFKSMFHFWCYRVFKISQISTGTLHFQDKETRKGSQNQRRVMFFARWESRCYEGRKDFEDNGLCVDKHE